MEEVIVYLLIIGAVIVNIVSNYKKEAEKNKKRNISKPAKPANTKTSTTLPSATKKQKTVKPSPVETQQRTSSRPVELKPAEATSYQPITSLETLESYYNPQDVPSIFENNEADIRISDEKILDIIEEKKPEYNLELDSPDVAKKAFVYSLIFDRKY